MMRSRHKRSNEPTCCGCGQGLPGAKGLPGDDGLGELEVFSSLNTRNFFPDGSDGPPGLPGADGIIHESDYPIPHMFPQVFLIELKEILELKIFLSLS